MTRPDRDYDATLSRALHSTLDPVEPAGDGLAKIQKRIAEPWLKRRMSLLRTELAALAWLILVRCEPLLDRARSGLAAITSGSHRGRASSGRRQGGASQDRTGDAGPRRWLEPTMAWLRPALAMAVAVVIVVAGVFALGHRLVFVAPANGSSSSTSSSHRHALKHRTRSAANGAGHGSSGHRTTGQSPSHKGTSKAGSKGASEPSSVISAPSSPSPAPSPSISPSPSPTPSLSPSPTPSPTTSSTSSSEGGTTSPSP
jgi:hypothetical protein